MIYRTFGKKWLETITDLMLWKIMILFFQVPVYAFASSFPTSFSTFSSFLFIY
jgi:hypothetical protein